MFDKDLQANDEAVDVLCGAKNQAEWRVYHQCKALYIIKPQGNARWRVMISSPTGADDMPSLKTWLFSCVATTK